MGTKFGFKDQTHYRKLLPFTFFAIFSIALFRFFFFYPLSSLPYPSHHHDPIIIAASTSLSSSPSSSSSLSSSSSYSQDKHRANDKDSVCDYTNGKWVPEKKGALYNGATCGTIKEGQNCISHGRPDKGYLYWKWKPNQCDIPRFDPLAFFTLLSNKHLAFVGDSMARNQLESLLCMLATVSNPRLVFKNGEDKFRKWHFDSHNVTVSVYWSPFLVKGVEKAAKSGLDHNVLYLDVVDERWGDDLEKVDLLILSIGHWFLHPAVYIENDLVLGCHSCTGLNHTEMGFFDAFRKSIRTTFETIIERTGHKGGNFNVILTTFSPSHFEGRPWDSLDACNATQPYEEKVLEGMDAEMRKIEVEETEAAKGKMGNEMGLRLGILDVTKLSLLRRDGHPGPYMYAYPFAEGVPKNLHNDCVHWCLPGPVDAWNEIMLQFFKDCMYDEEDDDIGVT